MEVQQKLELNQMWAPGWQRDGPDEPSPHESVFCHHPSYAAAPADSPALPSPPTPEGDKNRQVNLYPRLLGSKISHISSIFFFF